MVKGQADLAPTEHKKALEEVKKAGYKYLQTPFCKGDATIMMYLQGEKMTHAIKGGYEDVGYLLYEVLRQEPDLMKIVKINIKIIEDDNKDKDRQ